MTNQHDYDNFRTAFFLCLGIFVRKTSVYPTRLYVSEDYADIIRTSPHYIKKRDGTETYEKFLIIVVHNSHYIGFGI